MTANVKVNSSVRRIRSTQITLTGDAIRGLLLKVGHFVPDTATITVEIPRGGDYSGEKLDIDNDAPVVVTWTEAVGE